MKTDLFKAIILLVLSSNFAVSQFSVFKQFRDFNNEGKLPFSDLISIGDNFYGTISQGVSGIDPGNGGIFKISKMGTNYTIIKNFANTTQGMKPMGKLYFDGTYLYGTAYSGGGTSNGSFFKIKPDGTNFSSVSSRSPRGSFISDGSFLYTASQYGGTNSKGAVYKVNPSNLSSQVIFSFSNTNGEIPKGDLLLIGNTLYGMTERGGFHDKGTVFKINTDGTNFEKLFDFDGPQGAGGTEGLGGLITDGTFLYGMTNKGGVNGNGTIFKISMDGTTFQKIFDFYHPITGSSPFGSLLFINNRLFGTTSNGGSTAFGTIFMIKTSGSDYQKLHEFDGNFSGRAPFGSFYYENGFLYGMTSRTGTSPTTSDDGIIYKIGISQCSNSYGTDVITTCDSYTWINGQTYSASNNSATHILPNATGCDSIVTLNLTIKPKPLPTASFNGGVLNTGTFSTYQWYLNGSPIQGANSITYSPTQNGNYSVIVTGTNGCSGTSNIVSINTLSVSSILNSPINLYPNPAENFVTISNIPNGGILKINDANGKTVFENQINSNELIVNVSNYSNGIYSVIIEFEGKTYAEKLMITK
jgi:uncharacterized repeat protein (TIGR03803 family)